MFKKLLLSATAVVMAFSSWAQWDNTFNVSSFTVSQLAFSNSMVQVVCTLPDQIWTVLNTDAGAGCGNGFWAHKTDVNGNVLGSFLISKPGWELQVNAVEQFYADMFFAGAMVNCATGQREGFILALDNNGGFSGAYRIPGHGYVEVVDLLPLEPKTASSSNFMAIGFTRNNNTGFDPFVVVFDQGLNIVSTQSYPLPGDNIPYQGIVNPSNEVNLVGTEFNTGNEKLFTMVLSKAAVPTGPYITYGNSATQLRTPTICNHGSDLLIGATMDVTAGNDDILVISMNHLTRTINWANTYDYHPTDDGIQVADENGDITISFKSIDASSNAFHGLMFLDAAGAFLSAETYQSFTEPYVFCTIQSDANASVYYQASYRPNDLNLVEEGQFISSACEVSWSTSETPQNFNENDIYYDYTVMDYTQESFTVNPVNGDIFDCNGAGVSSFKKGTTGLGDIDLLNATLYPSPAQDLLHFEIDEAVEGLVTVFSSHGKMVYQQILNGQRGTIDVSAFDSGTYILEISSEEGTQSKYLFNKL